LFVDHHARPALAHRYPKDTETIVFYALALKSKSLINLEAEGGKIYRSLDTGKTVIIISIITISTIIVNNNIFIFLPEEESASDATVFYNQRKAGKMLELVLLEERYRHTAPSHMCNNRLKGKFPV
jgi:hypothetical protein